MMEDIKITYESGMTTEELVKEVNKKLSILDKKQSGIKNNIANIYIELQRINLSIEIAKETNNEITTHFKQIDKYMHKIIEVLDIDLENISEE